MDPWLSVLHHKEFLNIYIFGQTIDRRVVSLLENNHLPIMKKHPQLQNEIYNVLKHMRAEG